MSIDQTTPAANSIINAQLGALFMPMLQSAYDQLVTELQVPADAIRPQHLITSVLNQQRAMAADEFKAEIEDNYPSDLIDAIANYVRESYTQDFFFNELKFRYDPVATRMILADELLDLLKSTKPYSDANTEFWQNAISHVLEPSNLAKFATSDGVETFVSIITPDWRETL